MNILLIEDDPDLRQLYALQLSGRHNLLSAANAQSALDKLETNSVDGIILDIMLPYYNGFTVLYELISYPDWQDIPVIILSNLPAKQCGLTSSQLHSLGVVAYLEKAVTRQADLLHAIEAINV